MKKIKALVYEHQGYIIDNRPLKGGWWYVSKDGKVIDFCSTLTSAKELIDELVETSNNV